jgi:hypothetical protein
VSFSYRIRQYLIQFHDSIQCAMCFFVNNKFCTCANAFPNEFTVRSYEYARVNIEFFTGRKKIKQRRISFVLGYLRMILWKISTAISMKHRILATFNIKKIHSDSLYAFNTKLAIFQLFHDGNKLHPMRWQKCQVCIRPTRLVGFS